LKGNSSIIIIIVVLVLLLGGLLLLFSTPETDWSTHYEYDKKTPYGTHIIKSLLENNAADASFNFIKDSTYKELKSEPTDKVDNYFFIGENLLTSQRDIDSISQFVANGNKAFIISSYLDVRLLVKIITYHQQAQPAEASEELEEAYSYDEPVIEEENSNDEDELYEPYDGENNEETDEDFTEPAYSEEAYEDYESEEYDPWQYLKETTYVDDFTWDIVKSKLSDEKGVINHYYLYNLDTTAITWFSFNENLFDYLGDSLIETKGTIRSEITRPEFSRPNFVKIKYGKGYYYLHLNPMVFSNLHMLREDGMNHARKVLKETGNGSIYWSEDNRKYDYSEFQDEASRDIPGEGPMEFILSEPSLRKGWYVVISGVLLYFLFGAKRKQRTIPITEKKENTSIEYAEVIAQLFLSQTDHRKLIHLKTEQFKFYLRDRYNIKLSKDLYWEDKDLIKIISNKSNTRPELITSIIKEENYLRSYGIVDTEMMLSFHYKLEEFYHLSK
jgi:hypothetical protein